MTYNVIYFTTAVKSGNGEPENGKRPRGRSLCRLPRLTRSFSLKGWDVTALGNAQGQRMRIPSCVLFSFEALKGRHGGSPRPNRWPGFSPTSFSAPGPYPGRSRPSPSGWTNKEGTGNSGPETLGVAQGCYVSALRAERWKIGYAFAARGRR